jgi:hypothetical protein
VDDSRFAALEKPRPEESSGKKLVEGLAIRDWLGKIRGAAGLQSKNPQESAGELGETK